MTTLNIREPSFHNIKMSFYHFPITIVIINILKVMVCMFESQFKICLLLIGRKVPEDKGSLQDATDSSRPRYRRNLHPPYSDVIVSCALRHKRLVIFNLIWRTFISENLTVNFIQFLNALKSMRGLAARSSKAY